MSAIQRAVDLAMANLAEMSPEERAAMWRAQRESFLRAMTTPCGHGILDFEQCAQCRALPTPPKDQPHE